MAKAKKPRFISDSIRVSPMRLSLTDAYIVIETREARPAEVQLITIPIDSVPALIEALTDAAIQSAKKAKR